MTSMDVTHGNNQNGNSQWLTKLDAARMLGVSERTIESYISDQRVASRPQPRPGKRPLTVVDPDDVARLRAEQHRGAILAPEPAREIATGLSTLAPSLPPLVAALAENLAQRAPRAFLTLAGAAEYSGLPAGLLRRFIRRGELPSARYGRDVFVKTRDLDELQLELAIPEEFHADPA